MMEPYASCLQNWINPFDAHLKLHCEEFVDPALVNYLSQLAVIVEDLEALGRYYSLEDWLTLAKREWIKYDEDYELDLDTFTLLVKDLFLDRNVVDLGTCSFCRKPGSEKEDLYCFDYVDE